jgi:polysaccharide pyruvyl transferase WcaK-like protein
MPDQRSTKDSRQGPVRGPSRIGVLTFHRCINYGSYWQARCLVEGLCREGHDAVLLDHVSASVGRTEWRCALQPLLPTRSPRADIAAYAQKVRSFHRAIEALPLSRPFPLERPEAMDPFDLVIVGSDEVWNLTHPWYGGRPIFYGSGIPATRVASYAASFGNYDAEAGLALHWAERLGNFAAISVRDFNSGRLVRGAIGQDPPLVLDPCLQFPPPNQSAAQAAEEERPYVAVYGHSFSDWFGRMARRWAQRRGYRLVSIGYRNDWADEQRIDSSPFDFARLIGQAVAVVTNFFHGCVFSLLNAKPFVCAGAAYRINKVRDLARALGDERRLMFADPGERQFAQLLEEPPSSSVLQAIDHLRGESSKYLRAVLA